VQADGNYDIPQEGLLGLMHSYYQNEVVVYTEETQRIEAEPQRFSYELHVKSGDKRKGSK